MREHWSYAWVRVIGVLMVLVGAFLAVRLQLQNIDKTPLRIFLEHTGEALLIAVLLGFGFAMARHGRR